jgi:hypothetical protein
MDRIRGGPTGFAKEVRMEKWIEKFNALSLGEKIIIPAGAVLFICGFLPWYSVDLGVVSVSRNGWESPGAIWSILAILVGLGMAGVVVVKNLGTMEVPDNVGGFTWPKIYLGAGLAALLFLLIKLANESSYLGFAFYLGIIAAAALAVAGFLMFREESAA